MSQSTLQSAFETGAVKFNLAESDYIVLRCDGYDTYEKLFYRLPTREDLEKYMEDVLHRKGGFRDSAGIMRTYDKATSNGLMMLHVSASCGHMALPCVNRSWMIWPLGVEWDRRENQNHTCSRIRVGAEGSYQRHAEGSQ